MKKKTLFTGFIAALLVSALLAGCSAKQTEAPEIHQYVTDVSQIEIREGTRILALGEATHGNKEFQALKAQVFDTVTRKSNINALILEGDFGGCSLASAYINGEDGDSRELTKVLGYRLYRTDDMENLIKTMASYNETAAQKDKVRLYGMDIQRSMSNIKLIKSFYGTVNPEKASEVSSALDTYFGTEEYGYDKEHLDDAMHFSEDLGKDLDANAQAYTGQTDAETFFRTRIACDCLIYYLEVNETEKDYNRYRDMRMKELVDRILAFEEETYGSEVMIACHNGHMTKNDSSRFTYLGKDLSDTYGDAYFAIGTDFYLAHVNLPSGDGRTVKDFCSDDPLAYNMKDSSLPCGYLDFSKVPSDSPIYPLVNAMVPTGSVGEDSSPVLTLMKANYQLYFSPADMYDAMILYYEVTPTDIWED